MGIGNNSLAKSCAVETPIKREQVFSYFTKGELGTLETTLSTLSTEKSSYQSKSLRRVRSTFSLSNIRLPSMNSVRRLSLMVEDKKARIINHAKDADFSVWQVPIKDIIPQNLSALLAKEKLNKSVLFSVKRCSSLFMGLPFPTTLGGRERLGLTLQAFIDLTSHMPEDANIREFVKDFKEQSSSKWSMVKGLGGSKDSLGQAAVGKLNFFVSYTWEYKIKDVIGAIKLFEEKNKRKEPTYYFIDCVCINQWEIKSFLDNIISWIKACEGVILILKPWNAPVPLTRAWCLFEICTALHFKETVPLHIEMPEDEVISFHEAIVHSFDDVTAKLCKIDARAADATVKRDLQNIRNFIDHTIGYTALNHLIMNALGEWLAKVGAKILDQEFSNNYWERKMGFERLQSLAKFERHFGHKENALRLYKKAWNGLADTLGKDHRETIYAMSNFGNQLRENEMYSEAEKVLKDCLEMAADSLGELDAGCLIIKNNYALLKKNTGELEEAEKLLRECQSKGLDSRKKGAKSWDNLTRCSNLALVLSAQGKCEMAMEIFEQCLIDDKWAIGDRNPYTLTDMMNIGTVLWKLGRLEECESKMSKCYEKRVEVSGVNHMDTLMTLWWWTIALVKLGKISKARDNIEALEIGLGKIFESGDKRMEKLMALKKVITIDKHAPSWKSSLSPPVRIDIKNAERSIVEKACKNIHNLNGSRWNKFSSNQIYCGLIDMNKPYIVVDSFWNIARSFVNLRVDNLSARLNNALPQTFHERMLYICGLWEDYRKMNRNEKSWYRGFSYNKKHGGWRPGSCSLNVPSSAINAFRNKDSEMTEALVSDICQKEVNDNFAKLVNAHVMDNDTWTPLQKALLDMTHNGQESFDEGGHIEVIRETRSPVSGKSSLPIVIDTATDPAYEVSNFV